MIRPGERGETKTLSGKTFGSQDPGQAKIPSGNILNKYQTRAVAEGQREGGV